MAKDQGWIKLHRSIWDSWVWEDPKIFQRWIDLLLLVNHEKKEIKAGNDFIYIDAGQKLTAINKLAARWGVSDKTVKKTLNLFKMRDMITTKKYKNGTLINVINYGLYQSKGESKRPNKVPNEIPNEVPSKSTNKRTSKSPTMVPNGVQKVVPNEVPTNKNVKNDIKNDTTRMKRSAPRDPFGRGEPE
jgi:DNA replication protein DnaD